MPFWITSLGARVEVNEAAHSCGGGVLHVVINDTFARKAIAKGADGLVAVAAGAGGHAGQQSPLALIQEIRAIYDNYEALSTQILAASVRTVNHVQQAAIAGADVATVPPGVLQKLVEHPLTDKGLAQFLADWKKTGQSIL